MRGAISWQVELALAPGRLGEFEALTREMVESTRLECGVLIYERYLSDDGNTVVIYERYRDSAAAIEHLRKFDQTFRDRFASIVKRKRFTVFGKPSAALRALLDGRGATYVRPFHGFARFQQE